MCQEFAFKYLYLFCLIKCLICFQANRSILIEEDRVKMETEHAKAPVDFTTLQLHNLMYEKSHYLKAIKACKDFKTKYPDIELVPEEEFFCDAPEDIKGSTLSNDSAHNLMLKRLNFELFQVTICYSIHKSLLIVADPLFSNRVELKQKKRSQEKREKSAKMCLIIILCWRKSMIADSY